MRHFLLLLCAALPVLAQPLPLTWPQRPEGLVLASLSSMRYDGAGVAGNPGELVIAWCDARDGDGRVVLQKLSSQDPDHPGRWHSQLADWGQVDGFFLPAGPGAALMPWVVPDGQGGALAVYEELQDWMTNRLKVCRVGDGPDGLGASTWPEPTLVSEDVLIQSDDCRDQHGSRCRSVLYDNVKSACPDGAGGAWVAWRTGDSRLRLNHVNGDGTLDADFPTAGLELSPGCLHFSLAGDGLGNVVLAWQNWSDGEQPLLVQGLRPDGSLILPAGGLPLTLTGSVPNTMRLCTVGPGRVLAAWSNQLADRVTLQIQLLDEALLPLYPTGGLGLGACDYYNRIQAASAGPDGPIYLVWTRGDQGWIQRINLAGEPQWGDGVSVNQAGDGVELSLGGFTPLGDELACLLFDSGDMTGAYLQQLDNLGQPIHDNAQALLSTFQWQWAPAALVPDGSGGVLGAWQQFNGNRRELEIVARDGDAQDLIPADRRTHHSVREGYPYHVQLLPDGDPPLALWTSGDGLFLQAIDASDGESLLAVGGVEPLVQPFEDTFDACSDGGGGAWVVALAHNPVTPAATDIVRLRLGGDGSVLTPPAPLLPGQAAMPDFWGVTNLIAARGEDRLFAALGIYSTTSSLRLQACDESGALLWGDDGILLYECQPSEGVSAALLESDGADGCYLLWTLATGWMNSHTYLQHFNGSGQPLFPQNGGRGVVVSTVFYGGSNVDQASLVRLGEGAVALSWSERYRTDGQNTTPSLFLSVIDAQGDFAWSRTLSTHLNIAGALRQDPDGLLVLACSDYSEVEHSMRLLRYTTGGDPDGEWSTLMPANDWPQFCATFGAALPSVVVANAMSSNGVSCGMTGLSAGANGQLATDFCGSATSFPATSYNMSLEADARDGAWFAWSDGRCQPGGYGNQLRLLRVGELDDAVEPIAPVAPATITLAPNVPNPFNPETWIVFELGQTGPARLEVFNLAGQRVRVLHDGMLAAGTHRLRFDGRDEAGNALASGLYFHRLSALGQVRTGRMLLVR